MSDLRDLLERAVPRETAPAVLASEIRAIGRRRQRRSQIVGAAVSVVAIAAAGVLGVQFVRGAPAPSRPAIGATSPAPAPSLTGSEFSGLVGTRWIPDLVSTGISPTQAHPGEPGPAPRAMVTFGADHRLTLFYAADGRTTTVTGTWAATSETPQLDGESRGGLRLALTAPPGVSGVLEVLIAHLELTTDFAMWQNPDPGRSPAPLAMVAYRQSVASLELEQVSASTHLPAPYPSGP
jgi:hypothetical protein